MTRASGPVVAFEQHIESDPLESLSPLLVCLAEKRPRPGVLASGARVRRVLGGVENFDGRDCGRTPRREQLLIFAGFGDEAAFPQSVNYIYQDFAGIVQLFFESLEGQRRLPCGGA